METRYRLGAYLFTMLTVICFGCKSPEPSNGQSNQLIIKDGVGRSVAIAGTPRRIMALSPSMTEVLFLLTDTSQIIAKTDQCDYPKSCLELESVTIYPEVNIEQVIALNPELIVSNAEMTPREVADRLTTLGFPVLLYQIEGFDDWFEMIRSVGTIIHKNVQARAFITKSMEALEAIKGEASSVQKSALALISLDPIYVHGQRTLMNEKLQLLGFQNIIDSSLGRYPQLSREYILEKNPKVIYGFDYNHLDTTFFSLYPELKAIDAYQEKRIYPLNSDLASRPGARCIASVVEMKNEITKTSEH